MILHKRSEPWQGVIYSSARTSNRITKDKTLNKKLNKEISARATDDRNTKADEMHVLLLNPM